MLSVIIPAYNEEKMIDIAVRTICGVLDGASIESEIIFIDDGSSDNTWNEIKKFSSGNSAVLGVHFSRNFGKEAAIFAGLEAVKGDCCVILDCDLQHPPEKIVEMYRLWEQGFEVVEGIKTDRGKESAIHRGAASVFYGMISRAIGINMESSSDFKLLDRKVIDLLNQLPERGVFFRALSFWVGFKRAEVQYEVQERLEGQSKWSTRSLIKYAIDNIGCFSSLPLHIVTVLGFVMLFASVIFGTISLIQKIAGSAIGGFTTVIILLLFSASLIMISLGIIGYYVGRIYDEVKGRPRFIISEVCGESRNNVKDKQ